MKIGPHRNAHPRCYAKRRTRERQRVKEIIDVRDHDQRDVAVAAGGVECMLEIAEEPHVTDLRKAAAAMDKRLDKLDLQFGPVLLGNAHGERMRRVGGVGHYYSPVPRFYIFC